MQDSKFNAPRLKPRRPGMIIAASAGVLLAALAVAAVTTQVDAQDPKPRKAKAAPAAQAAPPAPPAGQDPTPPPRVDTSVFDQWTVVCQTPPDLAAKRNCSAVLKVVDPNRHQVVLAWVLARTPEGKIAAVIQAPTGVQVQRGLTLKLGDAGPARVIPFASCEPQNCEVDQVLDDANLRELEAAPQAVATIVAKDGRGIQFTMPLKGVDRALAAVRG